MAELWPIPASHLNVWGNQGSCLAPWPGGPVTGLGESGLMSRPLGGLPSCGAHAHTGRAVVMCSGSAWPTSHSPLPSGRVSRDPASPGVSPQQGTPLLSWEISELRGHAFRPRSAAFSPLSLQLILGLEHLPSGTPALRAACPGRPAAGRPCT